MMDTATSLETLSGDTFQGENVSKLANEAQRLIKIMKGGLCPPIPVCFSASPEGVRISESLL